jgi:hypothetical protein
MVTGVDSLRNRTSGGYQPVRKGGGSRGVPKSGCRVTFSRRNRARTAASTCGLRQGILLAWRRIPERKEQKIDREVWGSYRRGAGTNWAGNKEDSRGGEEIARGRAPRRDFS